MYKKLTQIMVSRLLLVFLLLFLHQFSLAQIILGPKAGIQITTTNPDEDDPDLNYKFKLGWNAGASFEFPFNDNISLYTELFYSRKGKKVEIGGENLTNTAVYHHIDLPITLKYTFGRGDVTQPVRYYLRAGGFLSYWLGGKGTISGGAGDLDYDLVFGEGESDLQTIRIEDPNRLQVGFDLGTGFMIFMYENQYLVTDIGASIGHSWLADEVVTQPQLLTFKDDLRATNFVISLNLAYVFRIELDKREKAKLNSTGSSSGPKKRTKPPGKMKKKKMEKKAINYINRRKKK